ncbi:MAG: sugar phosphate nucleotidyltransferase [Promethearchaeota archaeon]
MKAIILAAGFGSGMKSLSELIPKSLIPVANRPIIEHLIRNLQNKAISEIFLLVGHLNNQMEEFLKNLDLPLFNIKIIKAKNYEKGPIYTFNSALDLDLKEDFLLMPSDLFINPEIISFLIQHHKKNSISIAVDSSLRVNKGTKVFTYAESRLNSENRNVTYGKVSGFNDSVLNKAGAYATVIPISICPPKIFDYLEDAIAQNGTNVTSAFNIYIKKLNPIYYFNFSNNYWFDIDNLKDILLVNKFALKNNIIPLDHFSPTNRREIKDLNFPKINFHPTTEIIPPVVIGANCYSEKNSRMGPFVSLNNNCGLETNSRIENSIIFGNSHVPEDSIIKDVIIYKNKIFNVI